MTRSFLLACLATGVLALGLAACDEQQASDSTSVPMQQQGAVPPANDSSGTPMMQPPAEDAPTEQPDGGATPSQ